MNERYYFIDWLRIFAIILVLFFHVGMMFCAEWGWHIKNNQTSNLVLEFNFWLSRFRMPLLFFISGAGAYWALRKRTAWKFFKERHNRLMVPLLFSMLVIVPPQVFFERLFSGEFSGNYLQFWPSIFTSGPYPEGNMSWHHMWFVLYLFVYSAILLPVFLLLRKTRVQERLKNIKWLNSPIGIFALVLPTILMYIFWTTNWNRTNALVDDWGYFPYWMSFFLVGYLMSANGKYWQILEEKRKLFLKLAILSIVVENYIRWNDLEPWLLYGENWRSHLFSKFHLMLTPANAWFWLLAAVGYGKKYLNKSHPILAYANRGIYPFYILHQTIIICIGYYVVNLGDSIFTKYLFVLIISFILTVGIYEFLIRPYRITRFLFGVKETKKKKVKKDVAPIKEDVKEIEFENILS